MTRTKMEYYKVNPEKKEALALVKKVFALKEELDLSYDQMAKASGLSKEQLYRLKCLWVNGKGRQRFLKTDLANGLVQFWNAHLDSAVTEDILTEGITDTVIKEMLKKSGLKKTALLLSRRGKRHLLDKYLAKLSAPKLADLLEK